MYTKSTTIRINEETKEKLENLDFVKKHTFDEILLELIKFYEKRRSRNLKISGSLAKEVSSR